MRRRTLNREPCVYLKNRGSPAETLARVTVDLPGTRPFRMLSTGLRTAYSYRRWFFVFVFMWAFIFSVHQTVLSTCQTLNRGKPARRPAVVDADQLALELGDLALDQGLVVGRLEVPHHLQPQFWTKP